MDINLKGEQLHLDLYGYRTEMIYENRNKCTLDMTEVTATKIAELFYAVVAANLQKKGMEMIDFETFKSEIEDNNDGDITYVGFYLWYLEEKGKFNQLLHDELAKKNDAKEKKAQGQQPQKRKSK